MKLLRKLALLFCLVSVMQLPVRANGLLDALMQDPQAMARGFFKDFAKIDYWTHSRITLDLAGSYRIVIPVDNKGVVGSGAPYEPFVAERIHFEGGVASDLFDSAKEIFGVINARSGSTKASLVTGKAGDVTERKFEIMVSPAWKFVLKVGLLLKRQFGKSKTEGFYGHSFLPELAVLIMRLLNSVPQEAREGKKDLVGTWPRYAIRFLEGLSRKMSSDLEFTLTKEELEKYKSAADRQALQDRLHRDYLRSMINEHWRKYLRITKGEGGAVKFDDHGVVLSTIGIAASSIKCGSSQNAKRVAEALTRNSDMLKNFEKADITGTFYDYLAAYARVKEGDITHDIPSEQTKYRADLKEFKRIFNGIEPDFFDGGKDDDSALPGFKRGKNYYSDFYTDYGRLKKVYADDEFHPYKKLIKKLGDKFPNLSSQDKFPQILAVDDRVFCFSAKIGAMDTMRILGIMAMRLGDAYYREVSSPNSQIRKELEASRKRAQEAQAYLETDEGDFSRQAVEEVIEAVNEIQATKKTETPEAGTVLTKTGKEKLAENAWRREIYKEAQAAIKAGNLKPANIKRFIAKKMGETSPKGKELTTRIKNITDAAGGKALSKAQAALKSKAEEELNGEIRRYAGESDPRIVPTTEDEITDALSEDRVQYEDGEYTDRAKQEKFRQFIEQLRSASEAYEKARVDLADVSRKFVAKDDTAGRQAQEARVAAQKDAYKLAAENVRSIMLNFKAEEVVLYGEEIKRLEQKERAKLDAVKANYQAEIDALRAKQEADLSAAPAEAAVSATPEDAGEDADAAPAEAAADEDAGGDAGDAPTKAAGTAPVGAGGDHDESGAEAATPARPTDAGNVDQEIAAAEQKLRMMEAQTGNDEGETAYLQMIYQKEWDAAKAAFDKEKAVDGVKASDPQYVKAEKALQEASKKIELLKGRRQRIVILRERQEYIRKTLNILTPELDFDARTMSDKTIRHTEDKNLQASLRTKVDAWDTFNRERVLIQGSQTAGWFTRMGTKYNAAVAATRDRLNKMKGIDSFKRNFANLFLQSAYLRQYRDTVISLINRLFRGVHLDSEDLQAFRMHGGSAAVAVQA